jgi:prevent-host-death family protein
MAIINNGGIKMITKSYSIAEARDQFAALVRRVEEQKQPVHVTRRGETVAVILSAKRLRVAAHTTSAARFLAIVPNMAANMAG